MKNLRTVTPQVIPYSEVSEELTQKYIVQMLQELSVLADRVDLDDVAELISESVTIIDKRPPR